MKRNNKKKNSTMLLLILLLAISIGFAALATTLKINGTTNIKKQTWDIYWDNASIVANTNLANADITDGAHTKSGDVTTLEWGVNLNLPGDYYEFTVDAVNNGTIDAMITSIDSKLGNSSIISTENGSLVVANPSPMPSYIKYSVTYADGTAIGLNHLLSKKTNDTATTEKYKVRVEYDKDAVKNSDIESIPSQGLELEFTFSVTYSQADDSAIPKPISWILPEGKTANTLSLGDEVCLNDECFNFVRYDGNNAVMLAKYNLKVGYIYDDDDVEQGRYTNSTAGYNKQSSDAKGYVAGETRYGTVAFAATNYWWDSENYEIKPKYGNDFDTNNVYDTDYTTEPDFSTTCSYMSHNCFYTPGYSAAYYVEEYKEILEGLGATIESTRLLTYEDVEDASIGCSWSGCPTTGTGSFVTRTSFWLASAADEATIIYIDTTGNLMDSTFGNDREFGVRPVIVVAKSNL